MVYAAESKAAPAVKTRPGLDKLCDLVLIPVLLAGFLAVAGQRIGSFPLPDDGDESMILQVPYEILNRGKFAWPMYRYLGGNIENAWHSFRPVYYLMLTGFFKLFGWGLTQGRVFNLLTAAAALLLVYLIGRRLFDWRAGLAGVVMLVSDPIFFERSRMIRNEYPAAMFALLAFYLYEIAADRKSGRLYFASGLAAGAGVMVHTNLLYILVAIPLLMLFREGRGLFTRKPLYQFGGAALAVMAYEVIYDIVDYKNVQAQYHGDRAHFSVHSPFDLLSNLIIEYRRYASWYHGGELIAAISPRLLHCFQGLLVAAILYLIWIAARRIRSGDLMADARVRVLVVTTVAVLFLAATTGHKRKYNIYLPNVTPWFALCVGILVHDMLELLSSPRVTSWLARRSLRTAALAALWIAVAAYGFLLARQNYRYYKEITRPGHASFAEFAAVLRGIVPRGVCPISITRPVIWLVFPESDRCYATYEGRMDVPSDIAGQEFAVIVPAGREPEWPASVLDSFHLIGEMDDTAYGDLRIYYAGKNPLYTSLRPRRYRFSGLQAGYSAPTN